MGSGNYIDNLYGGMLKKQSLKALAIYKGRQWSAWNTYDDLVDITRANIESAESYADIAAHMLALQHVAIRQGNAGALLGCIQKVMDEIQGAKAQTVQARSPSPVTTVGLKNLFLPIPQNQKAQEPQHTLVEVLKAGYCYRRADELEKENMVDTYKISKIVLGLKIQEKNQPKADNGWTRHLTRSPTR